MPTSVRSTTRRQRLPSARTIASAIARAIALPLSLSLLVGWFAIAEAQKGPPISRGEKLEILEHVWKAVNERYYDRSFHGVDWNAQLATMRPRMDDASDRLEFYRFLRKMIGTLGDAHTRVFSPEDAFDRNRPSGITTGLSVRRVEGAAVIIWVEPSSEAAKQGLRPGQRIKTIDGNPVEQLLAAAREDLGLSSTAVAREVLSFERIFYGPRDTLAEVEVVDQEGHTRKAVLRRRFVEFQRRVLTRRLPGEIGYIELTGFGPEVEREFDAAILSNQSSRGLILDLRNNGGGFVTTVARVASHFFSRETELGVFITRQGKASPRRTERLKNIYRGPVVILVSARSASGAEMLAAALQERKRATIVGNSATTCGCLVGVSRSVNLPDGGKLNVSDTDFRTAFGRRVEGTGVLPDERLELRIADLTEGRDRALEWAVDYLGRLDVPADADLSTEHAKR
ncbi:MAG: S41 family peptidase [Acidobacteriota bacterium]